MPRTALARLALTLALTMAPAGARAGADRPTVLVVAGTPGTPEYGVAFRSWLDRWRDAARRAGADFAAIGDQAPAPTAETPAPPADRDRLRDFLADRAKANPPGALWLVLIGHGSFDGREAKFNLRGPDCTGTELAAWLKPLAGPVAVLDCTSSSGPFLTKLSGANRVVVTATKSGQEQNYARLGQFLAAAWADPHADLDKDGQTSLLEAFLLASKQTADFYKTQARLSSEHALIDDNADGKGTPADWFEGTRLTRKPKDGAADGLKAGQLHLIPNERDRQIPPEVLRRRNELELQVAALQERKSTLEEANYYRELEPLMIQLARTYAEAPRPADR